MSASALPQASSDVANATEKTVARRLDALEDKVKELKPSKDGWDKFEKVSTILWSAIALLISIFVTGRIENALKERQLHLENVKEMQQLMQLLDKADASSSMSYALALGAHGKYSVAPMIQVLQTGVPEHRPAALAGLRAAAAVDHDFVCEQLVGVIKNRTRLYQAEVHSAAAGLLGDLDCQESINPLRSYIARLQSAAPANAPFTAIPGSQGVSQENISTVKQVAEDSLRALTQN